MSSSTTKASATSDDFSEADYLALNPDVADAVARGEFASGWHHFRQWGKAEGRVIRRTSLDRLMGDAPIISLDYPRHQNALNIFGDTWVAAMPDGSGLTAGTLPHFDGARVRWAADVIGDLAGKSILELGPFEGYDAYTFEQLGAATVLSIDNNTTNFLKCLVVKNIFGLRTTFLLGDFVQFMEVNNSRYDVCWMSGVLYHMNDPIRLLRAASQISDILFIWTHFYDDWVIDADSEKKAPFRPELDRAEEFAGRRIMLHYRSYGGRKRNDFSGGSDEYSFWFTKDDITHVLNSLGYNRIVVGHDEPNHIHGPSCSMVAFR
jgi:SAM-dependent methyltransferase